MTWNFGIWSHWIPFGWDLLDQIQLTTGHLEVSVYHAGLISVIGGPIDPVRGFQYGGGHESVFEYAVLFTLLVALECIEEMEKKILFF